MSVSCFTSSSLRRRARRSSGESSPSSTDVRAAYASLSRCPHSQEVVVLGLHAVLGTLQLLRNDLECLSHTLAIAEVFESDDLQHLDDVLVAPDKPCASCHCRTPLDDVLCLRVYALTLLNVASRLVLV